MRLWHSRSLCLHGQHSCLTETCKQQRANCCTRVYWEQSAAAHMSFELSSVHTAITVYDLIAALLHFEQFKKKGCISWLTCLDCLKWVRSYLWDLGN